MERCGPMASMRYTQDQCQTHFPYKSCRYRLCRKPHAPQHRSYPARTHQYESRDGAVRGTGICNRV